jgi:acetyl-CoA C-acetyltransferase
MKSIYIIAATRTPIGGFGGQFSSLSATELGAIAIQGAFDMAKLDKNAADEIFFGNVLSANLGQAPAKQAALKAGLPANLPSTTINKVCASGMKATIIGSQSIMSETNQIVVSGGMESMTNCPYYLPQHRWGTKFGHSTAIDGLAKDGLTDAYQPELMGSFADKTAKALNISRKEQDEFTFLSYQRAENATKAGKFLNEIIPVTTKNQTFAADEEFSKVNFEKIPSLKPAFSPDGTVTAANASTISDGASAIILASEDCLKKFNLTPLARIVSFSDASQDPEWFTTTPAIAAKLALKKAGLTTSDIDYFEINEAFAVVALAFIHEMKIPLEKTNIHGGAIALGHPLGTSGARIICTLTHILQQYPGKFGMATLCNGGGGASAIIIEKV